MIYVIGAIVVLVFAILFFRKSPAAEMAEVDSKARNQMNARMIGDKTPTFRN